jgi:hypothetical protein
VFLLFQCKAGRDNRLVIYGQDYDLGFKKRPTMTLTWKLTTIIIGIVACTAVPSYAQLGAGPQDAATILKSMPPDLLVKVQALAQILQQGIKDGKLTDAEVQQGMLSGRLGERLKQLSPESGQLLDEISDASKLGKGPGEDSLIPLLGGLGSSGQ